MPWIAGQGRKRSKTAAPGTLPSSKGRLNRSQTWPALGDFDVCEPVSEANLARLSGHCAGNLVSRSLVHNSSNAAAAVEVNVGMPPSHGPSRCWRASNRAPQPSVATRARLAQPGWPTPHLPSGS